MFTDEYFEQVLSKISDIKTIDISEFPDIDLYMDQVTTFMEQHLEEFKRHSDDKVLTKTMINNYAKCNLLPPPVKKKYSKEHMLLLVYIYHMKNTLSINDIQTLLTPLCEYYFDADSTGVKADSKSQAYNSSDVEATADPSDAKTMESIYDSLMSAAQAGSTYVVEDARNKYAQAKALTGTDDTADGYLTEYTFISLLCYDIFIRKYMIERMIDDMRLKQEEQKDQKGAAAAAAKKAAKEAALQAKEAALQAKEAALQAKEAAREAKTVAKGSISTE